METNRCDNCRGSRKLHEPSPTRKVLISSLRVISLQWHFWFVFCLHLEIQILTRFDIMTHHKGLGKETLQMHATRGQISQEDAFYALIVKSAAKEEKFRHFAVSLF